VTKLRNRWASTDFPVPETPANQGMVLHGVFMSQHSA